MNTRLTANYSAYRPKLFCPPPGFCAYTGSFDQAVRLLDSGLLNLEFMITHTLPLDQIHEAIDLLRRGEGVEVLVDPNL